MRREALLNPMSGGVGVVGLVLLFSASAVWLAVPLPTAPSPVPADAIVVRVDNATSVTIWERTTNLYELTYPVTTLTGPGATFDTVASERYTFTSDGASLRIHCYRNSYQTGANSGNNIAAARLNGVPGYPDGIYASIIVSYAMGYGGLEDLRFNALGTNLSDITYMGDQDSEIVLGFTVDVTSNRAPMIHAVSADPVDEGAAMRFRVNASDADGDTLAYDYDFDGDGIFDLTGGGPEADHVFGDDFAGTARIRVRDAESSAEATTSVLVRNVAPTIDAAQPFALADVTLRVSGEKWHDVRMDLLRDNQLAGSVGVTRYPGSPDRQSATVSGARLPLLGSFAITIVYTPDDDPVNGQRNGANPVWVVLTFSDGAVVKLHHTFNVRHSATWTWTLDDLRPFLTERPVAFGATASDVGSDDLMFAWDFGDGATAIAPYYNDGVGPDPFPSPDVNPIAARDVQAHAFALGTYVITLRVTDDDGGFATASWTLTFE